jgi:hypothetical protein
VPHRAVGEELLPANDQVLDLVVSRAEQLAEPIRLQRRDWDVRDRHSFGCCRFRASLSGPQEADAGTRAHRGRAMADSRVIGDPPESGSTTAPLPTCRGRSRVAFAE